VRDTRIVGDVFLGAGIALVGVAVALWVFSGSKTPAPRAVLAY
jgi:hypothetical protein